VLTVDTFRPSGRLDAAASAELADLEARFRAAFPSLQRPLRWVWSDDPLLVLDRERPWLVTPLSRDPQARGGRPILPREQRRQLTELARLAVPFDAVATAHELDTTGPAAQLVPMLRAGPRRCTDELAHELVDPVPPDPRVERAAGVLGSLAGAAVGSLAGAVTTAADVLLDPILFGVVAPARLTHGQPCLLYPLVVWIW
jgi:hypothetical protein